tara:strand:- start:231 stop:377 length:147 start_codon:yes stop_codon:yes gene_type:complete
MTGAIFEPPPRVAGTIDEDGYVRITPQEWASLTAWMERFTKFVANNYD